MPPTIETAPLACGTRSFSMTRWVLRRERRELVLAPTAPARGPLIFLAVLYFAFGIWWGVFAGRASDDTHGVLLGFGLLVATGTSVAVIAIYRALSRAEIARGPVLRWDAAAGTVSLPRRGLSFPLADVRRLELFSGWKKIHRTLTRWAELDLVLVRDGTYERHNLLSGVTRLPALARELAREMTVPLERLV